MSHSNTEFLIDYWQNRSFGPKPAMRAAIDPADFPTLLPQVFILGRHTPGLYAFRLCGGLLRDLHGKDLRGVDFSTLWAQDARLSVLSGLERARRQAEPLQLKARAVSGGQSADLEITLMPLSNEAGAVDRVLGLYQPVTPLARLRGLPAERVEETLELVGLVHAAERNFGDYSQGMRQRLGVAGALMHRPRLVVLDEPTSGLDPAGTREMRALLPRIASEGTTLILASHLLTEVEQVCTRVAIMKAGAIISTGDVDTLLAQRPRWRVRVTPSERASATHALRALPVVHAVQEVGDDLEVETQAGGVELNRALIDAGIVASELEPVVATLESVFIELTEGTPAS